MKTPNEDRDVEKMHLFKGTEIIVSATSTSDSDYDVEFLFKWTKETVLLRIYSDGLDDQKFYRNSQVSTNTWSFIYL